MLTSFLENYSGQPDSRLQKRFRRLRTKFRKRRQAEIIRNRGVRLAVDDSAISPAMRMRLYEDNYEKQEVAILSATLKEHDTVMELGAGLGFLSIFAAQHIDARKVHAYEANPSLIPLIERNYRLNGVSPHLHNRVLTSSPTPGVCKFHLAEDFWASSMVETGEGTSSIDVPTAPFIMELRTIDPSYLVIDIEGGEEELIVSDDFHNVKRVLIELHPSKIGKAATDRVRDVLLSAGFSENLQRSIGKVRLFER